MATTYERGPEGVAIEPEGRLAFIKRISWGAVFAGVVVALVSQIVLGLLGLAIGLGAIDPLHQQNPVEGIGTGAGIWFVVTLIISLFLGGLVAGRLAGVPRHVDSTLHGIVTWGVTTLVIVYLLTTAVGAVISGVTGALGQGLSLVGRGVGAAAPKVAQMAGNALQSQGIDITSIKNNIDQILRETGKPELQPQNLQRRADQTGNQAKQGAANAAQNPQNAGDQLMAIWGRIIASGKDVVDAADRDALVNVLVARTTMDRQQAENTVSQWEQTYQQAKVKMNQLAQGAEQQARQIGDTAARTLSQAALWTFIGFVVGLIAAALGGYVSRPRDAVIPVSPRAV